MLSMYDIVENMEKERKIIEYDYDLNDICKKYKEEEKKICYYMKLATE